LDGTQKRHKILEPKESETEKPGGVVEDGKIVAVTIGLVYPTSLVKQTPSHVAGWAVGAA